jgi:hypothetical protein
MEVLLTFIASELCWLFDGGWFRIVDGGSRGRSGSVTFRSAAMLVEFVNENGELSGRVRATDGEPDWFWIGVLSRLFAGDLPGSDVLDAHSAKSLRSLLREVDLGFGDPLRRDDLLRQLDEARSARADQVFGV